MSTAKKYTKSLPQLSLIPLVGIVLIGCVTIRAGSHHDESVSFSDYRTFAWIADDPLIRGAGDQSPISPLSQKKIVQAIENELGNKGYEQTAKRNQADFVVSYTVGTRERIDATSYPSGYYGDWGWHLHGRYYYRAEVVHRTYTEGTLGIDIFDGKTKQPIWHGWATKKILTSDRDDPSPAIQKTVARIIEQFPPTP